MAVIEDASVDAFPQRAPCADFRNFGFGRKQGGQLAFGLCAAADRWTIGLIRRREHDRYRSQREQQVQ